MFRLSGPRRAAAAALRAFEAICATRAAIEFDLEGRILRANDPFLAFMGWRRDEILGQHHRIFMPPEEAGSPAYAAFWDRLRLGEAFTGEAVRRTRDGRSVVMQASYVPVPGPDGRPERVVKLASDITETVRERELNAARLDGVSRSQAVIEFDAEGRVLAANPNFLRLTGYAESEVLGRHHRMFMPPGEADKPAYAEFWRRLAAGELMRGAFRRVGRGGREIWIEASYNPVLDHHGRTDRIIKFALDATERAQALRAVGDAMGRLAEGDLAARVERAVPAEYELLRTGFNAMAERIGALVAAIAEASERIRAGTGAIAEGGRDLARRAEAQAATLEQTAATMEEITATIGSTAGNAETGSAIAVEAEDRARRGQEVVRSAIAAVGAIEESAARISEITAVINSISFQTNLLALNAAVEAARAGDAGKGFAVVAAEVRTLAQRSSTAASDIGRLIEESSAKVREGAALVKGSGAALEEIMAAVQGLKTRTGEISEAMREQSNGVQEVSRGVADLDGITQQNSALAESNARNAAELMEEADRLMQLVAGFRSDSARAGRRAAA